MNFFDQLYPADTSLFYSRNDLNDIRLGEIVLYKKEDYARSNVVILGCPQDEGIRRNKGRPGARHAPQEIRKALYRYPVSESHTYLKLFDAGNIPIDKDLEVIHDIQSQIVQQIVKDGKKIIVLGGGNDISYPDCRALSKESDSLLVFNIDRHLDVRKNPNRNSGTPYRQLLEEGYVQPEFFHEIGINSFANSPAYINYINETGASIHYLGDLRKNGIIKSLQEIVSRSSAAGIFFGFDLDVVRAVEAPGVSDPGPMGLTAGEVCEIADVAASDPRTLLIEVTEVNPEYDKDGITSKLAANIIMRALAK